MAQTILATGGAGFIGSHTCVALLDAGHDVVVVDNLDNSSRRSLERVREITGREPEFHQIDLLDAAGLERVFASRPVDAVVHFAGLKSVSESTQAPLRYYQNNVTGSLVLLETMQRHGVRDLVFSSSCTVYGDAASVPVREDFPLQPVCPYGRTKLVIEEILRDLAGCEEGWRIVSLRYFNPVGAHESGLIGEDPRGTPGNLLPYIMQVAVGRHPHLNVFGSDWPTRDGTGVRDFIHVVDLAAAHLAALDRLPNTRGCEAYNLGTGRGVSVLEMLEAARRATGEAIPHEMLPRRPGDTAESYADPSRAAEALQWSAQRGVDEICADAWRWQSDNPHGFGEP